MLAHDHLAMEQLETRTVLNADLPGIAAHVNTDAAAEIVVCRREEQIDVANDAVAQTPTDTHLYDVKLAENQFHMSGDLAVNMTDNTLSIAVTNVNFDASEKITAALSNLDVLMNRLFDGRAEVSTTLTDDGFTIDVNLGATGSSLDEIPLTTDLSAETSISWELGSHSGSASSDHAAADGEGTVDRASADLSGDVATSTDASAGNEAFIGPMDIGPYSGVVLNNSELGIANEVTASLSGADAGIDGNLSGDHTVTNELVNVDGDFSVDGSLADNLIQSEVVLNALINADGTFNFDPANFAFNSIPSDFTGLTDLSVAGSFDGDPGRYAMDALNSPTASVLGISDPSLLNDFNNNVNFDNSFGSGRDDLELASASAVDQVLTDFSLFGMSSLSPSFL